MYCSLSIKLEIKTKITQIYAINHQLSLYNINIDIIMYFIRIKEILRAGITQYL